ncbi:hypothetical protein OIU34_36795 [Pararhizobium sp. BT-229]|nr:hypothetical protein [Pararhizobium sp. BT-229]
MADDNYRAIATTNRGKFTESYSSGRLRRGRTWRRSIRTKRSWKRPWGAVAVVAGQAVKSGDVLLSIEAMKMETALHAEKDGTIAEVLVHTGDQIDAKDLLIVYGA